jgi:hypothetical protein
MGGSSSSAGMEQDDRDKQEAVQPWEFLNMEFLFKWKEGIS